MRIWIMGLALACSAFAARAEEISSVYAEIKVERDCTTFASSDGSEGEYANLVCNGYGGYPVLIYSGDLRESLYYGFPRGGDLQPAWESFAAFNSAGPKIEWRVAKEGNNTIPFATIHRWNVSDPEDAEKQVEVLVIEKVGQIGEQEGCAVGLVLATGNPKANETARKIADEQARGFACGDERVVVGEPMPQFDRQQN
jgi:hypothetical protein